MSDYSKFYPHISTSSPNFRFPLGFFPPLKASPLLFPSNYPEVTSIIHLPVVALGLFRVVFGLISHLFWNYCYFERIIFFWSCCHFVESLSVCCCLWKFVLNRYSQLLNLTFCFGHFYPYPFPSGSTHKLQEQEICCATKWIIFPVKDKKMDL